MLMSKLVPIAFPAGMISLGLEKASSKLDGLSTSALEPGFGDTYTFYTGNGSTAAGWPSRDDWVDFYTMWEKNEGLMNVSCSEIFNATNNSPTENEDILDAIQQVSYSTGVDKRFILAIIMQESMGCVRVRTTASPGQKIQNPGLMQTHSGVGSCENHGNVTAPCGPVMINLMIEDGVSGTNAGDGLKQLLKKAPGTGATKFYQAARMYNSGAIAPSGDLGQGCCTHCYASDVANRLTGWVKAANKCTLDGS
ncbi:hypothetical protein M433DRAFT_155821 [Acidomyces richmondensis BFW]|nr:MAG: hypothetical protein FE78DRAFT_92564 [Acidomyces sp. 'richmondensis']KYG44244.1 hypothetical protein M433DRAFT_155821 [Acidomyces richmondensis BFW]